MGLLSSNFVEAATTVFNMSMMTIFWVSFLPCVDDLMSLLDGGIHSDHPSVIIDADAMFSEDFLGIPQRSRSRASGSSRGRLGIQITMAWPGSSRVGEPFTRKTKMRKKIKKI